MARLTSGPPAALGTQALGSRLLETVAGGGLAAVMAVFGKLGFRIRHTGRQGVHLTLVLGQQARDQSDDCGAALIVDLTDLIGRHNRTLPNHART